MRLFHNIAFVLMAALVPVIAGADGAMAQQAGSYVTPFPEKGTYKIYVFGDSLGNGIWSGLYGAFRRDPEVRVVKKSKAATGFVRNDFYDWNRVVERVTKGEQFDIAVVMFGANDRQPIRIKRRRYRVGAREWKAEYSRRVDNFIKTLKRKNVAVYWVGLPIMRSQRANKAMQIINQIVREKAYLNGVKYIDTWSGFTDQDGGYSPFGPDLGGRIKRLRIQDGVHFTGAGYRKLAHYVEREIRRDISVAKAERSIPLAGGLQEQRRIMRRKSVQRARPVNAVPRPEGARPAEPVRPVIAPQRRSLPAQEYGADNSKITIKKYAMGGRAKGRVVEILRPAIPPAVVNHILRRVSSLKASNVGESVTGPLDGGLIAMSSITPVSRQAGRTFKQNVPITQTPYYRVLIKGAVLQPKPGRADDFKWRSSQNKPSG